MSAFAIRRLILAIAATAILVPVVTAGEGEASRRHHLRKHRNQFAPGWNDPRRISPNRYDPWIARGVRPAAPSWSGGGSVCPGNARSFDCKIWPPPFDDDPDRKASGADAGG